MNEMELFYRKMPTERLIEEIQLVQQELKTARKVLKARTYPEKTSWICSVCKVASSDELDDIVQHIKRDHLYPQTHAIEKTQEIFL